MFVGSTSPSIYQSDIQPDIQPASTQTKGRYSDLIPVIAKNINKIAIPILFVLTTSNILGVDAGPLSYGVCVSGCELAFTQAGLFGAIPSGGWSLLALVGSGPACATLCAPVLAAPSP